MNKIILNIVSWVLLFSAIELFITSGASFAVLSVIAGYTSGDFFRGFLT